MYDDSRGIDALPSSELKKTCEAAGGIRSFVRDSKRSYSGWVLCCIFDNKESATFYAQKMAEYLAIPYCRMREIPIGYKKNGYSISVPCISPSVEKKNKS